MARRTLKDRTIRKLFRSNNGSYYLTVPIEHVRDLKWRGNQKVVVERRGKELVIKDWKG